MDRGFFGESLRCYCVLIFGTLSTKSKNTNELFFDDKIDNMTHSSL